VGVIMNTVTPLVRFANVSDAYMILYSDGLPPATEHTVAVDMQVFTAGGTVRIYATRNSRHWHQFDKAKKN
jgi:hypothetical protein